MRHHSFQGKRVKLFRNTYKSYFLLRLKVAGSYPDWACEAVRNGTTHIAQQTESLQRIISPVPLYFRLLIRKGSVSNKESILMKIKSPKGKCSASYCLLVIKKYIEYSLPAIFLGVQWPDGIIEICFPNNTREYFIASQFAQATNNFSFIHSCIYSFQKYCIDLHPCARHVVQR